MIKDFFNKDIVPSIIKELNNLNIKEEDLKFNGEYCLDQHYHLYEFDYLDYTLEIIGYNNGNVEINKMKKL